MAINRSVPEIESCFSLRSSTDVSNIMDLVDTLWMLDLSKTRFAENATLYHFHPVMKRT